MQIREIYITNKGNHRKNNQDSLTVNEIVINNVDMNKPEEETISSDSVVVLVSDGMGGYENGEIASKIVLETFLENKDRLTSKHQFENAIMESKEKLACNDIVCSKGECGATISGVYFYQGKGYIVNIGDSRTYRLNEKYLEKLTKDHSLVQHLHDMGMITEDEMRFHPEKNIITSAITNAETGDVPENNFKIITIKEGDIFLICSDGIWESISHEELESYIDRENLLLSVEKIYNKCMEKLGNDNLTIIIVLVEKL